MSTTNKKPPGARGIQPFNQRAVHAPHCKPGVAQRQTAMSANGVRCPVAPPIYRPQTVPKVLQTKRASVPNPTAPRQPVAPPVYRPQPTPQVLQKKSSATQNPQTVQATRPPAYRPQHVPQVLQRKTGPIQPAKPPQQARVPSRLPVTPKVAPPQRPSHTRTTNTVQGYFGDAWEPAGYGATFRGTARDRIAAQFVTARAFKKGARGKRKAVTAENTFAAYAEIIFRSDDGRSETIPIGARLSGNPSNKDGQMYPDHSVRLTSYNQDCAEYYLIKQARRLMEDIRYTAGFPPRPSLYVYSDHSPCPNCQKDFDRLQLQFPDLQLVIMYEKRYQAHQEDDVWEWDLEDPNQQKVTLIGQPEDESRLSGTQRLSAADVADGWQEAGGRRR